MAQQPASKPETTNGRISSLETDVAWIKGTLADVKTDVRFVRDRILVIVALAALVPPILIEVAKGLIRR